MWKEENTNLMAYSMPRLTHFTRLTYTHTHTHLCPHKHICHVLCKAELRQLRHTPPMIRVTTIHTQLLIQAHLRRCQAVTHFKAAHSTLTIPSASHFNWMWVIFMTNVGRLPLCMCIYVWVCLCGRESQIRSASVSTSPEEMSSLVTSG